jgi:hypothetical protein
VTPFARHQRDYSALLAACKEREDEEFERDYAAPQRAYLAFLADRGKPNRAPRPAKWERDLALMADDGS